MTLFDLIVSECQSSVAMSDTSPILKKATKGGGIEVKVVGPGGRTVKAAGSEDLRAELEEARAQGTLQPNPGSRSCRRWPRRSRWVGGRYQDLAP